MKNLRNSYDVNQEQYLKMADTLNHFEEFLEFITGSLMLVVLALLGFFMIKHKRVQRFVVTIFASMAIKYTIWVFYFTFKTSIDQNKLLSVVLFTIASASGPITHCIYASQYTKTCVLIPGLAKRARLLMDKHQSTIENGYELKIPVKEFLRIHKEIVIDIKKEKARS